MKQCNNCGDMNDNQSNFCKSCGSYLKRSPADGNAIANPHDTIFENSSRVPLPANTDLGYLIIAILTILNILTWIAWRFLSGLITSNNETTYTLIRFVSVIFTLAQFIVMFIFSRRPAYRVVIVIIAGIVVIYDIYLLIETFDRYN